MEKELRVFKIRGRECYLSKDEVQKEFGCPPEDVEEIWKAGRRTRVELWKQMKAHGKTDPWELTEFDQWVNDATRKDIENLLGENSNVFGLKFWSWVRIPPEKLKGICNFGVDLIFREEDKEQVEELINDYQQNKHGWNVKKAKALTEKLFDLAILDCTWV